MGDILESGALPGRAGKPNRARATELYDYFRKRAKSLNYWSDNQFVEFLQELGAQRIRSNGTVWVFPPLQEVRTRFRALRPWWPDFDHAMTEWESEFDDGDAGWFKLSKPSDAIHLYRLGLIDFGQLGLLGQDLLH